MKQAVAYRLSRGWSMAETVGAKFLTKQTAIDRRQTPSLQERFL